MAKGSNRRDIPKLNHEAVREHLVDYHFSRLSPQMNAAVERHVRSCQICQQEGLLHLATQRREAVRVTRKRGSTRRSTRQFRMFALLLSVALVIVLFLVTTARGQRWPWTGRGTQPPHATTASATPAVTPTIATLSAAQSFGSKSAATEAMAISPDGKYVAFGGQYSSTSSVSIWDTKNATQVRSVSLDTNGAIGSLAWSPDGSRLAGTDGTYVYVWNVANGSRLWSLLVPHPPAFRVYDVQAAVVIQRIDPSTAFAQGPYLRWGSNGQLSPQSGGIRGSPGVAMSGGSFVGLWQVAGSHVFSSGGGHAYVGMSSSDNAAHVALLSWSPDSRYLFWASSSGAVGGAAGAPVAGEMSPPDATAASIAARIAQANAGNAYLWFSPDGRWVAVCDETTHGAPLSLVSLGSNRTAAVVHGSCAGMTASAFAWRSDTAGFVVAMPGQPVDSYVTPRQP